DGVIHSAGLLRPALVPLLSVEELESSLLAKAAGAWVLDRVTAHLKLDFFLVNASLASLQPLIGLGAYASANAYQDAFAHSRARRTGQRTLALNWGPWGETGLATAPELLEEMRRRGLEPLSNAQGQA